MNNTSNNDLIEKMKEIFPSKEDLHSIKGSVDSMKENMDSMKENMDSMKENMDSLKVQINTIGTDVKEIKKTVQMINKRDLEDSNALMRSSVSHDKRLGRIEKILKIKNIYPVTNIKVAPTK